MTNEKSIEELSNLLSKNGWFDSVRVDSFGKMVVFVHYCNLDVMKSIPDRFEGKQVVWQYASSKPEIVRSKYATTYKSDYNFVPSVTQLINIPKYIEINHPINEDKELDINFLISELDRLEKLCGSNILQNIFYEVHDGKNAVTNLKTNFPEIYDDMLDLYEEFGFDIIYGELDG